MSRATLLGGLLVAAVAAAVTAPALDNPFVLDDRVKIVENPDLRTLDGFPGRLVAPYGTPRRLSRDDPSRPLVYAAWTLVYQVAGLAPWAYRLLNVLGHALAAALAFVILRRLLATLGPAPAGGPDPNLPAALAGGLLFATLPIQTGTAIYVYGFSDVLGAALSLAALALFLTPTRARVAGSAACMALALAAKQSAVVLPALLLAVDVVLRPGEGWRARARRLLPHVVIAVLWLGARLAWFGAVGDLEGAGEREPAGAYALVQPWVLLRYLQLTLVPVGLSIDHWLPPGAVPGVLLAVGVVGVAAALGAAVVLWRRGGPAPRLVALGVALFALALAPTSSVLPTVDPMVERRVYLGTLGVLLVGAVALRALLLRARRTALLACVLAVAAYAAVSVHRARIHGSRLGLWDEVLARHPESPRALNNRATILMAEGRFDEARATLEGLLARQEHAIPLANLARVLELAPPPQRDEARALDLYERAIAQGAVPGWVYAQAGRLHHRQRDLARAALRLREALDRAPDAAGVWNDLGVVEAERGRRAEARRCWEEALRLAPGFDAARRNLERARASGD